MLLFCLFLSLNEAKIAYNDGLYGVAKLGFLEAINQGENKKECYYYLTKIADKVGSDIEIFQWGMSFIDENPLEKNVPEIISLVLNSILRQRWSYGAKHFIQKLSKLMDKKDLMRVVDSLVVWKDAPSAAQILLELGEKDTRLKAIRILDSLQEFNKISKLTVTTNEGYLYRASARLVSGDSLGSFFDFLTTDFTNINNSSRYAQLAINFGFAKFGRIVLSNKKDFALNARLSIMLNDKASARSYLSKMSNDSIESHIELCLDAEYLVSPALLIGVDKKTLNEFYKLAIKYKKVDEAYIIANLMSDGAKMLAVRNMIFNGSGYQEEVDSLRIRAEQFEKIDQHDSAYYYYYRLKDYEGLARVLYKVGNLKDAYRLTKDDSLRYLILKASGKDVTELIRRNPKKSWAVIESARSLLNKQSPSEALIQLLHIGGSERLPYIVDALDQLGADSLALRVIEHYKLADEKSLQVLYALDRFDRIISLTNTIEDSIHRLYRMKAYVRKGYLTKAKSLASGIDHTAYYESVCEYLIKKKRFGKVDSLMMLLEVKSPKIIYLQALIPFYTGDFDAAVVSLQDYLRSEKAFRNQAIFKLGTSYYQLNDFDNAQIYFKSLLNNQELKKDALHNLIICLKKISAWEEIIELEPIIGDDADKLYEIGYAYLRKGQTRKALKVFEEVRRNIYSAEVQYWLAEAKSGAGDLKGALLEYYRLYLDFRDAPEWRITSYFKIGVILEVIGDKEGAKVVYRNIMKRGEGDVWYEEAKNRLNNLD